MKIIFFSNTCWYLYNFRIELAKFLRDQGFEVIMLDPPYEYAEKLARENFIIKSLPLRRRSLNPFRELFIIWKVWRILATEKPQILHSFTLKCVIHGGIAARLRNGVMRVSAIAGMGYVFSSKRLSARILKLIVRPLLGFAIRGKNSRLILQNPNDMTYISEMRLLPHKSIHLIKGSGVNSKRFTPASTTNDTGAVRVILAARLLIDKGIGEFIEAAKILASQSVNADFYLAGSIDPGNPSSIEHEDLEKWQSQGYVQFLGQRDDMEKLLPTMDIAVLPSNYGEGVPRFLIEAAACGLPLIATSIPGCIEIVQDGINGFLIPVKDSQRLAKVIEKLATDASLRKKMGIASRKIMLESFEESAVFEKTFMVYKDLLDSA